MPYFKKNYLFAILLLSTFYTLFYATFQPFSGRFERTKSLIIIGFLIFFCFIVSFGFSDEIEKLRSRVIKISSGNVLTGMIKLLPLSIILTIILALVQAAIPIFIYGKTPVAIGFPYIFVSLTLGKFLWLGVGYDIFIFNLLILLFGRYDLKSNLD
jgi:hypothetical protein